MVEEIKPGLDFQKLRECTLVLAQFTVMAMNHGNTALQRSMMKTDDDTHHNSLYIDCVLNWNVFSRGVNFFKGA